MTNDDLYQIILLFLRKDRRGGVLSELEYHKELRRMNTSYMNMSLVEYEKDQDITDKLTPFKTVVDGSGLTMVGNLITVPSDYIRHSYLVYKKDGTDVRELDILTDAQWGSRIGSSVSEPEERFPVAKYRGGYIEVRPTGLTKNYFEYGYIRYPIDPYYDGYYDVNGNFIYMPPGTPSYTLGAGEVGLDGQTSGSYVTKSVELEWHDDDKWEIADMVARRMGAVLKEPLLIEYNNLISKEK